MNAIKWRDVLLVSFGFIIACTIVHSCLMLQRGSCMEQIAVAAILLLYCLLGLFLLKREGVFGDELSVMSFVIGIANLIRVLCFDYASGDYGAHLSRWYIFFKENGGFEAIKNSVGDYNVPYLYFMAAISYCSVPDLYMIKLFSVLFDVLLAWGCFRLSSFLAPDRPRLPLIVFSIVLFLPTVVINSSYWGQCDGVYCALCVHAVNSLLRKHNKLSVMLVAAAFSFKLQTVFILPLWGIYFVSKKLKLRELLLFPFTYFVIIAPAVLLGKPLRDTLEIYFTQMSEYPALTMNAPSVYQFLPYGVEVNETVLFWLGIAVAAALCVLVLWFGRNATLQGTVSAIVVLCIGIPFFLPCMHERYFYLADVFTTCCACLNRDYRRIAVLTCGSSMLSYFVFLNCSFNAVVYCWGYPFVMVIEAGMMLAALILSVLHMLKKEPPSCV